MPLDLDGPWAKLDRAAEHLNALDFGCRLFLATKPYYVAAEFDPEAGHHVVRLRIRREVPIALSVVVGELVHSLRSALDQAVWVIACRSNPVEKLWRPKVARDIAFPFADKREHFQGRKVMRYIAADAKAVLDEAQPYQRTDRAIALAHVDRLWNIDKHRVVHGGFAIINLSDMGLRPAAIFPEQFVADPIEYVLPPDQIAKDGMLIARAYFAPPQRELRSVTTPRPTPPRWK